MKDAKERIETTAEAMVKKYGVVNLTMSAVCNKAKVPTGSFVHYMGKSWSEYLLELRVHVEGEGFVTIKRARANTLDRYTQVLNVALNLAKSTGYDKLTIGEVAKGSGVSRTIITNHLGNVDQLRDTVLLAAVRRGIPEIVAQGIANHDMVALSAPKKIKAEALSVLKRIAKC